MKLVFNYPVQASDSLFLEGKISGIHVVFFNDLQGTKVKSFYFGGDAAEPISVVDLASGLYLMIHTSASGETFTAKFSKE